MADLNLLSQGIAYLFGEVLEDTVLLGAFATVPKAPASEKRYEILVPLASIGYSITSAATCAIIASLCQRLPLDWIPKDCLELVDGLSCISVFALVYMLIRRKSVHKIIDVGKTLINGHDSFLHIYVPKGRHGDYQLSKQWHFIKFAVGVLIAANCLILMGLYKLEKEMNPSILEFRSIQILPIACLVFFAEVYSLLSCREDGDDELPEGENAGMDLVRLLAEYERYAEEKNITVSIKYQEHKIELREESLPLQKKCRSSDDCYVQYLMHYVEEREEEGQFYPSQCLDTAVRLTRGENVFFATPFYKDIDICIFFPVFLALLRREKALILLEDNGELERFRQWIKEGIEQIQDMVDLWKIDVLQEYVRDIDVGILPFQSICRINEMRGIETFLREVSFVVILEAADLLTGGQEAISHLAERIKDGMKGCTWFLCDRNAESVLDLFSHLLNAEFVYVGATPLNASQMVTACWNLTREPPQVWDPVMRYLGIGAGIMEVAGRSGIDYITWYGEEMMPVRDWKWIVGQYYRQYGNRTAQLPQQVRVNSMARCEVSGVSCQRERAKFVVVEDSAFNLYEVERQYATRGEEKLMLHILSPKYMLRDYMLSREETMRADAKYIAQFVPEYVGSNRNAALKLVRRMLERPVPETEVEEIFRCGEEPHNPASCLVKIEDAIQMILNIPKADIAVNYRTIYAEQRRAMVQEPCYQLVDERAKREFGKYFRQARYLDEQGNKRYISRLFLSGHLEQKYQPGQFVVLDGKYYEVSGFFEDEYEKLLEVKRASEQFFSRQYYRQRRYYRIQNSVLGGVTSKIVFRRNTMQIQRCTVDISGYTYGYQELKEWNNIAESRFVLNLNAREERRQYQGKQLLRVESLENDSQHMVSCLWLAVLLNEAFCTLYPQYYHLLSVGIDRSLYKDLMERNGMDRRTFRTILANVKGMNAENCFYILEDSREDMGLLRSLERNFQRIVNILQNYIQWSEEHGDKYIRFGSDARSRLAEELSDPL